MLEYEKDGKDKTETELSLKIGGNNDRVFHYSLHSITPESVQKQIQG